MKRQLPPSMLTFSLYRGDDSINRDRLIEIHSYELSFKVEKNELKPGSASICRVNVARLSRAVVVVVWRPRSIRAESVILLLAPRSKHLERYFQTRDAFVHAFYPSIYPVVHRSVLYQHNNRRPPIAFLPSSFIEIFPSSFSIFLLDSKTRSIVY